MALCRRLQPSVCSTLWAVVICKFPKRLYYDRTDTLEFDSVDDFTTQLVHQKAEKWMRYRERKKIVHNQYMSPIKELRVNTEHLSLEEIDSLLKDANEVSNTEAVREIICQCEKFKKFPSMNVLLQTLECAAQKGDKDTIIFIRDAYKNVNRGILEANSGFRHFLAEAIWLKGNITEAINLLEEVYRTNPYIRYRIRLMLKHLIDDGVSNRSEANLCNMLKFCERLAKDFNDYYPMVLIWRSCIVSEWFSDQCVALDLLKKHEDLCEAVTNLLSFTIVIALNKNQTDTVYRLLEVFLSQERKTQTLRVLITLFDYKLREGDIRSCSEIIKWSLKNNINLPSIQQEKFISLLINNDVRRPAGSISRENPKPPFSLQF